MIERFIWHERIRHESRRVDHGHMPPCSGQGLPSHRVTPVCCGLLLYESATVEEAGSVSQTSWAHSFHLCLMPQDLCVLGALGFCGRVQYKERTKRAVSCANGTASSTGVRDAVMYVSAVAGRKLRL